METINTPQINDQNNGQTLIIKQEVAQKNGVGIAGFVLAVTGLVLCWAPVIKWLLLVPAFLLSFIGMFKATRTLAIIGTIVSGLVIFIKVIIKVAFIGALL